MAEEETVMSTLGKIAHEPVVHFFLIAILIFGFYGINSLNQENVLEIDQWEIDARIFAQEMRRGEALPEEERHLVTTRYIEEQILVREALALNLDNDARIHDMLAQKMLHVLSGDIIQPTQDELQQYYDDNQFRYIIPKSLDVVELVFDSREPLPEEIQTLLNAQTDPEKILALSPGNSGPLPLVTEVDLSNIFDDKFATQLMAAEPGHWTGPFVSNRGQHWIQINNVVPERLPPLEEIQDQVRLEWIKSEEDARLQEEITKLFDKYTVIISEETEKE